MNATSIIMMTGVVSFWGAMVLMVMFFNRLRVTMKSIETTLASVQSDLAELAPAISSTLQEVEKTGQEVGQTAVEVRSLARNVNSGSALSLISGTVRYLPAAIGLFRLAKPLFSRKRRSK